jgi:ATP-dependent DNA ligase
MDEKDVIERLGQPDQTVDRKNRMRSLGWVCSTCRSATAFAMPMPCPAPCSWCGGIAFETVDGPPQ